MLHPGYPNMYPLFSRHFESMIFSYFPLEGSQGGHPSNRSIADQEKHSEEIVQGPPSSPEPNRRRSSKGWIFLAEDLPRLGQWLNFKLFGITYLVGKIKFKLLFQGPLAK